MASLRALIDMASEHAEGMFDPADVLMPHIVAEDSQGGLVLAALAADGPDLERLRKVAELRFALGGYRRWVFFSEGYQVEYAGGPSTHEPQDHPERIHVILFDAYDARALRRRRATRQILRTEAGHKILPLVFPTCHVVDVPARTQSNPGRAGS